MAKNFEHVSHIKSKLPKENINPEEFYGLTPTVDNSDAEGSSPIKVKFPKLPTKDNLIEGEIAVNYLKGHETLSIKNTENEIVGFVNENEFFQAQEIISSALGQEKNDRIESITKIEEKLDLKANSADLATVATSGSYNDLADKPVIPEGAVVDEALSDTSKNPVQNKVVNDAIGKKQDTISDLKTIRSGAALGATAYQKPSTGIPASDIAEGVIPTVPTNVSAFTNDAGYLTQHQSLDDYYTKQDVNVLTSKFFDNVKYDSDSKKINFTNGDDVIATIDATGFIKDGMVSNVEILESNLVITFNTDAGQEPISIALTDIFNPANYYDKAAMDGKLALKADKTEIPDVSTFATKEEVNAAVSAINSKDEAQDAEIALKAVKADVDAALALKADKTELPDVSTFATKTELNAKANTADLAAVATSGSYNDLTNKPEIPERTVVDTALSDTSENPVQNKVVKAAIDAKQDVISDLATIRSGAALGATAYQKPSTGIPASDIAEGVIPTVPTNVSAFTNDAGYLKEHQSLDDYYTKLEVDNQFTAIDKRMTDFDKGIDDLELIVSSSLNDMNTRIEEISSDNTNQFTAIDKRITDFDEGIDDLELIVSSSLNDMNTRVETNLSTINSLLNKIDKLTQRVTALESRNTSAG